MADQKQIFFDDKSAVILLAAGASVRMGETKQLLPLCGETLLERVLNEALKSGLDRVVLVLGHQANKIRSKLKPAFQHPLVKVSPFTTPLVLKFD